MTSLAGQYLDDKGGIKYIAEITNKFRRQKINYHFM